MTFKRILNPDEFPENLKNGVVAIGNFDGVHRGHQCVLQTAVSLAKQAQVSASVLTFEPHPRTVFKPDAPVPRLTPAPIKAEIIQGLGFDAVIEYPFNRDFSNTTAIEFVKEALIGKFGVSHVVTGYDFHFAKGREGSPEFLAKNGDELGFTTTIVSAFEDEGGETVSSSRIRNYLNEGDISQANGLLGYTFRVSGEVIKGAQLGRTLNYPTANLSLPPEQPLRHGIYAVRVKLEDGSLRDGVASYGRRPTFDNGEALLESFIFDFSGDLYGQTITVYLYGWIRGEEKFDSVDALIEQMDKDSEEAKMILSSLGPEQGLSPIHHL